MFAPLEARANRAARKNTLARGLQPLQLRKLPWEGLAPGRTMKRRAALIGLLIVTGACSRAKVAPFDEIDRNQDGRISRQEAAQDVDLAERFAKLDTDADGELTPFEYLKYLQVSNRL
jgi:hypothetical protein